MKPYLLEAAVCNDKGRIRQNNEDNYYLNGHRMALTHVDEGSTLTHSSAKPHQLFAVCDGMGGESAGEVASSAVVEALHAFSTKTPGAISQGQLTKALSDVSADIYHQAHAQGLRSGSTFVGLVWESNTAWAANVGDSRAYRLSGGKLEQLSLDHSEVQRLVSMGLITKEAARTHPKRNVISQYLGMPTEEVTVEPSLSQPVTAQPGERYLLCSDGLTDMVEDADIERILARALSAREAAVQLVDIALKNGGRDNVTVLCVFVHKAGKLSALQKTMLLGSLACGATGLVFLAELIFRLL